MIRKYCDRCGVEIRNTFWKNPKVESDHTIVVGFNQSRTFELYLCLGCFKKTESEIYNLFNWYFKKEEEERVKIGI